MKELKQNLLRFSIDLWKGEMQKYEQVFISLNTSFNDALKIIGIINRNGRSWLLNTELKMEDIQLQFTTECLAVTSLGASESNLIFHSLLK